MDVPRIAECQPGRQNIPASCTRLCECQSRLHMPRPMWQHSATVHTRRICLAHSCAEDAGNSHPTPMMANDMNTTKSVAGSENGCQSGMTSWCPAQYSSCTAGMEMCEPPPPYAESKHGDQASRSGTASKQVHLCRKIHVGTHVGSMKSYVQDLHRHRQVSECWHMPVGIHIQCGGHCLVAEASCGLQKDICILERLSCKLQG